MALAALEQPLDSRHRNFSKFPLLIYLVVDNIHVMDDAMQQTNPQQPADPRNTK